MSNCNEAISDELPRRIRSPQEGQTRRFWRSLEEASGDPAFEDYLHREFPSQLAVWNDAVGRRDFLKLMAASLALAGVAGCTRSPEENIVPYVHSPNTISSAKPQFYATAMPRGGYGYPVLAESQFGRPTKIEGNPDHPLTRGGTDVFMQASILGLYDPDRSQTVRRRGNIETWDTIAKFIADELPLLRKQHGRGLRILTPTITSPTLSSQLQVVLQTFPEARWHVHEPVGQQNAMAGAQQAFGRPVDGLYHFDLARIVVALDSNFLTDLPGSLKYARDFIDGRRIVANSQSMNRLYVAEGTPSITGAAADHRLALRPSQIETLAQTILRAVSASGDRADEVQVPGVSPSWLASLIADLKEHRGASIVVAGPGQAAEVHALVHAINHGLGNIGKTVSLIEPVAVMPSQPGSAFSDLVEDMRRKRVDTLLMLGGNPVYNSPHELQFADRLSTVRSRIHLSDFYDETSFLCDWHIPAAHYLESWGDIRAADGTSSIQQPLIAPLYAGKSAIEILDLLIGPANRSSFDIVQAHWNRELGKDFGNQWQRAVHDGFIADTQSKPVDVKLKPDIGQLAGAQPKEPTDQAVEIEFHPDPAVWDGEYANNAWLQELPKPLTKLTWDNVALVSLNTAAQWKLTNRDVVEVTVDGCTLRAPVWVMPGQADNCVSLTLGLGRSRSGRIGTSVGYNAYSILPVKEARFASGTIRKTGDRYLLSTTQQHHNMEGRDIVRVTSLEEVQHPPQSNEEPNKEEALRKASEKLSFYPSYEYEGNAWGMVIDQTACIGCNACMVACQAENNVPVVGKHQVSAGREMHWLRIDRYFEGDEHQPSIYFQPMMCVHCELAPCEVVCPVGATVHDSEGTSNMVYNRCVGTRYCSNNCPYKVRRFNYLQFSDDTTASLKLQRNPDVSVRSRGVMEKCSYCIQRISHARIDAKIEGLSLVPDGSFQTACQQACPTRAITFGNLNDRDSKLHGLKKSALNYSVLGELNTEPRTTYLARVENPHPGVE